MSDRLDQIQAALAEALSPLHMEIVDESHKHAGHAGAAAGGGHFRALLVSRRFEGLSRMARQRLVYQVLDPWMGNQIHAFSMRTFTPEEWPQPGDP